MSSCTRHYHHVSSCTHRYHPMLSCTGHYHHMPSHTRRYHHVLSHTRRYHPVSSCTGLVAREPTVRRPPASERDVTPAVSLKRWLPGPPPPGSAAPGWGWGPGTSIRSEFPGGPDALVRGTDSESPGLCHTRGKTGAPCPGARGSGQVLSGNCQVRGRTTPATLRGHRGLAAGTPGPRLRRAPLSTVPRAQAAWGSVSCCGKAGQVR